MLKINIQSYRSVLHVERAYELQEHSASFALFQGLKTLYLNVISFSYCLFCQGRRMFLLSELRDICELRVEDL